MKFTSVNTSPFFAALKDGKIKAIMLYGQDKGVIDYIFSMIVKNFSKTSYVYSYSDAISRGLDVILNNISLFGSSDIIKITDVPPAINADLKEILLLGTHHIPILIADELSPSSSLRKFFESEDSLASMACYNDDAKNVRAIAYGKITASQKTIDADALSYLSWNLNGDRNIIENELEKLLLYTSNATSIRLEDVESSVSSNIISSPDFLCISFAKGDAKKFFTESTNLLSENISIVWIIRAISRYYINLYVVAIQKSMGVSQEAAISSLKPPIFFKYLLDFKDISNSVSLEKITKVLFLLHKAEAESKSSTISAESICENLFFRVHYAAL